MPRSSIFGRGLLGALVVSLAVLCIAASVLMPQHAHAQTVGTYTDTSTSSTKAAIGVTVVSGASAVNAFSLSNDTSSAQIGLYTNTQNLVFTGGTQWARQRGDANGTVFLPALTNTWWKYVPPTGGLTNSTAGITIKAAAGAGITNTVVGGECYADALGTATEIELRDGASGTAMFRTKISTAGLPSHVNFSFNPPIRGTANTLIEFAEVTANGTGSIYCNWQGATGA